MYFWKEGYKKEAKQKTKTNKRTNKSNFEIFESALDEIIEYAFKITF